MVLGAASRRAAARSRGLRAAAPQPVEIALPGTVRARRTVDVAAPLDGTLDQYLVDVGEQVFEGEVLARIKSPAADAAAENARVDAERAQARVTELEAQLGVARLEASRAHSDAARAKAAIETTRKNFERQQLLMQAGATPRLDFEKARQDYKDANSQSGEFDFTAEKADERITELTKQIADAKAAVSAKGGDLDAAEARMSAGEVRSPVDGVVVARRGKPGDSVDRGVKDLIEIAVDLSALEVVLQADPKTARRLRQGQAAQIEIAEAPAAIPGTVQEIAGGRVIVDFTNPSVAIKPGLAAVVKIKVNAIS